MEEKQDPSDVEFQKAHRLWDPTKVAVVTACVDVGFDVDVDPIPEVQKSRADCYRRMSW